MCPCVRVSLGLRQSTGTARLSLTMPLRAFVVLAALAAFVAGQCSRECEGAASCTLGPDRTTRTCVYSAATTGFVRPPTGSTALVFDASGGVGGSNNAIGISGGAAYQVVTRPRSQVARSYGIYVASNGADAVSGGGRAAGGQGGRTPGRVETGGSGGASGSTRAFALACVRADRASQWGLGCRRRLCDYCHR